MAYCNACVVSVPFFHLYLGPLEHRMRAGPQFKQTGGELPSRKGPSNQQASKEKRHTNHSRGSKKEGGEDELDQAPAYYDKVYFDSSGSEEEEGDKVITL